MNILLIGSGGREHAIAWKIAKNSRVEKIFVAPGNAGTSLEKKCFNVNLKNNKEYLEFALRNKVYLTIVGPEVPLMEGIVDLFKKHNLKIFGPDKKASKLEWSKIFSKNFMKRHHIATAEYSVFYDFNKAVAYCKECKYPMVIKADGLAAGKGVVICATKNQALKTLSDFMKDNILSSAGNSIVIEEFLEGKEVSIICVTDGESIVPFISSKDHKQVFDGDEGPNTGGMGAICPNPYYTDKIKKQFESSIMLKTLNGLKKDNINFTGFLFFGIMLCKDGPKLLEYNVRMGDPETQSILPLLKNDFIEIIDTCLEKKLNLYKFKWLNKSSVNVVLCSKGYPKKTVVGKTILIDKIPEGKLFYAGAQTKNNSIITSGGRVMSVVQLGNNKEEASKKVYSYIKNISFEGMFFRKDII